MGRPGPEEIQKKLQDKEKKHFLDIPSGVYRIQKDIANPYHDRRCKYDWRYVAKIGSGSRIAITTQSEIIEFIKDHGEGQSLSYKKTIFRMCGSVSEILYDLSGPFSKLIPLILENSVREPDTVNSLIHEHDLKQHSLIRIIQVIVGTGKLDLSLLKDIIVAERDGRLGEVVEGLIEI